jgi:hypothetical protein
MSSNDSQETSKKHSKAIANASRSLNKPVDLDKQMTAAQNLIARQIKVLNLNSVGYKKLSRDDAQALINYTKLLDILLTKRDSAYENLPEELKAKLEAND